MVGSRVLALALFAAYSVWMAALVVIAHYVIMLIWICCQKPNFTKAPTEKNQDKCAVLIEFACKALFSCVLLFDFLNLRKGQTRKRAVFYYIIVFLQNYVMIIVWYTMSQHKDVHVAIGQLVVALASGWYGIFFLLLHYHCCHRKKDKIPVCISWRKMNICTEEETEEVEAKEEEEEEEC